MPTTQAETINADLLAFLEADHAELDIGGVGAGHDGFGHGKAGADGAVEQGPEPAAAVLVDAEEL